MTDKQSKLRTPIYWLAGLILAVAAFFVGMTLAGSGEIDARAASQATMAATVADEAGVDFSSAFVLQFSDNVKAADVQKNISCEPNILLVAHQGGSKKEVLLAPSKPLRANTLYRFTLQAGDESFAYAFQTKEDYTLVASQPADQELDVALSGDIRLTFNQINYQDPRDFISIEPEVEGSFSVNGRTVVFTPSEPLREQTIYKVTVAADWNLSGSTQVLGEDQSFAFETASSADDGGFSVSAAAACFYPDEEQSFIANYNDNSVSLDCTIYQYSDMTAYSAVFEQDRLIYPTWSNSFLSKTTAKEDGLSRLDSFTVNLKKHGGSSFSLPQSLDEGFYLLQAKSGDQMRYCLFQVGGLKAYGLKAAGETLFWLHKASGAPASGAQIFLPDGTAVSADANGLITVKADLPEDTVLPLTYSAGSQLLFAPRDSLMEAFAAQKVLLYTDYDAYPLIGEINFWGNIASAAAEDETSELTVALYGPAMPEVLTETVVAVEDGFFSGSLAYRSFGEGEYTLKLAVDGQVIYARDLVLNASGKTALLGVEDIDDGQQIIFDQSAYQIGESYQAVAPFTARQCLYLQNKKDGLQKTVVSDNMLTDVFDEDDLWDGTLVCLGFDGESYQLSRVARLPFDRDSLCLQLDLKGGRDAYTPGDKVKFTVSVSDAVGQAAAATLLLSATNQDGTSLSATNAVTEVFAADDRVLRVASPEVTDNFLFMQEVTAADGLVEFEFTIPEQSFELTVLAVADGLQLGVASLDGSVTPSASLPATSIDTGDKKLAVITSADRAAVINDLYDLATSDKRGFEALLAAASAQKLLRDYAEDYFQITANAAGLLFYQTPAGGIASELKAPPDDMLSLLVAVVGSDVFANDRLAAYFVMLLQQGDLSQQVIALAGLAALGYPVLTECNVVMLNNDLNTQQTLAMIWALDYLGDGKRAADIYKGLDIEAEVADQSLAVILAARFNDASDYAAHLLTAEDDDPLVKLLSDRAALPRLQNDLSGSYLLDGDKHKFTLSGKEDLLLVLTREEADGLQSDSEAAILLFDL